MRKVIFGINITLDGCCDHTKGIADEETHDYFTGLIQNAGLLVYGRKTYELMVPFWPDIAKNNSGETKSMNAFARAFDSVEKVVFSHTLAHVEDKNSRVVSTDLRDEMVRLKQEQGKDIMVGGVDLPSQLIKMGLVDEYVFVVHPVIAGEGRRLLEGISLPEQFHLKLIESKFFKSGIVALRYSKQ